MGSDRKAPTVGQRPRSRRLAWSAALGLLVVALTSYSWMFSEITVPNERTRVYLAVAVVDHGSLSIDEPCRRFGRPADVARFEGRYYTDKAPGSSLLAAGVYGVARLASSPDDWTSAELVNLVRSWLMIPLGLVGFFLLRRLLSELGVGPGAADVVSLGWILGSSAFHYSSAFYGHQIVAVALLAALLLVGPAARPRGGWGTALRYAGAGAAAGLAGLTEYQSAIPCFLLACYVVFHARRSPGLVAAFLGGALPFVGLLLGYNTFAFGGPLELSYEHLLSKQVQALHSQGIAGVTWPQGEAMFGSLLSLHRGLLATSPFFVLVLPGLVYMWRSERTRSLVPLLGLSIAYYLLFIFGAQHWQAGWSFGPRLLVPVMAWCAIPIAFAAHHFARSPIATGVVRGLVIAGVATHQLVHVVFQELPKTAENPLVDLVLPALEAGVLSPNLAAQLTGHPGGWTAVPALLLAAAAIAVIVFRGLGRVPGRRRRRLAALVSIMTVVPLLLVVALSGPSWSKHRTKKHLDWMKKLERSESYGSVEP